jgi:hypothetical protein
MRKWGIVLGLFYAVIVIGLLIPAASLLVDYHIPFTSEFFDSLKDIYTVGFVWFVAVILIGGEAILLFLTVDTSQKRLRPRTHIAISYTVTAAFFALLVFAAFTALEVAIFGDTYILTSIAEIIGIWAGLWLLWGAVFYLYTRNSPVATTRILSWLLKGSILELLIAVPCHVIVRRRHDCSAPFATGFGIATGVAVMLLCFGPSVLLLYKKRLDSYSTRRTTT